MAVGKDNRGDKMGLWGAVAVGIGGMVGGGIFAVLGLVADRARGGTPVSFLIAGIVALLTASSYAVLSTKYPSKGGSVVFVDRVFGVGLATGSLNNLLWAGYLVTLALYAVAFANYAHAIFSSGESSGLIFHLLVSTAILLPTGINLLSAEIVAKSETAIVVLKLIMLGLVVGVGMATVDPGSLSPSQWPILAAVAAAGMLVFVAYEGFELIANSGIDRRFGSTRILGRSSVLGVVEFNPE